ncbi:MAG: hypothetical protein WDW38_003932 [Sanguina aurantia]
MVVHSTASRLARSISNCDEEDVSIFCSEELTDEYFRYIALQVASRQEPLSPPPAIEQLWCLHVLGTQSYAHMCTYVTPGGAFLHHSSLRPSPKDRLAGVARARQAYTQCFRAPPPDSVWGRAEAGSSHSISLDATNYARLGLGPLVIHRDNPSTNSVSMVSPSDCSTRSSSSGWSSPASSGPSSPRLCTIPTSDGLNALRGASPHVIRPDLRFGPLARGAPTPELAGLSPPTPKPSFAAKLQQGIVAVQMHGEAPPSVATPPFVAPAERSPVQASTTSSGLTYKEQKFSYGTYTWETISCDVRRDILEPRLENNHLSKAHFNASIVHIIMGLSRGAVVNFMKRVPTKAGLIRNPNHKMEKLMMHLLRDVLINVHDKLPPFDRANTWSMDAMSVSADCASVQYSSSASGGMSTSSSTNSLSSLIPATSPEGYRDGCGHSLEALLNLQARA